MPPTSRPLSVVCWNIRFGIKIDTAIEELQRIDAIPTPDILLLQEMDEQGTAAIAESLEANFAYSCAAPHAQTQRDFGNAIISPWPISETVELPLPHKATVNGHPRSATRATVAVDGTEVLVYSVHTEIPAMRLPRRIQQFQRIANDIQSHPAGPVIVGGDFNTVTQRGVTALKATMAQANLTHVSAEAGPSFRRMGRAVPLDHVFASHLRATSSGVAWTATASDHMPMWVELERETPTNKVE